MHRVPQNGEEGCGAACVAMIAGVTYDEARSRLPPHYDTRGTTGEELRAALLAFGIKTDELRSIGRKDFETFAFDAVLRGWLEDAWHWVVWEAKRKRVIDPYEPGYKFRCTSYVRVVR